MNIATGDYSHAEGTDTYARGNCSHAEGQGNTAGGDASHVEGTTCIAEGASSHAEGQYTKALGHSSHSEGQGTIAHGFGQHVQGKNNIQDTEEKYAHIVGNGDTINDPSNAHTIDWHGNGWFAGKIKVGGTGQDDENAKEVATKEYVDSKFGESAEEVSKIGTWTVVDDPVVPVSELPLKFTSNGGEYTYIGIGSTGPDQWGIRNLRYCNGDANVDVVVYTNNPSESYGITHGWSNEAYKTITITEEPTNRHVIDWLENNTDAPRGKDACLLPSFNASNEGQFLRIVNGIPEWGTITSAEGSEF